VEAAPGGAAEQKRVVWRCNLPVLAAALPGIAQFDVGVADPAPYAGPTLFVGGAKSGYISDKQLPAIHKLFPTAQVHLIPDAGHWVHAEKPKEFAEIIQPWLEQLEQLEQ